MVRAWRRALVLVVLSAILGACGRSDHVSQEKAIALATQTTPLATVEDVLGTPPGPVMWCLLGADKNGRPMAVWVRKTVEGQVYLDEGTSREDAVSSARRLAEDMGYSVINPRAVLVNPAKPTWWIAVKIEEQYWGHIFVDFATGEARPSPNDPWGKTKSSSP